MLFYRLKVYFQIAKDQNALRYDKIMYMFAVQSNMMDLMVQGRPAVPAIFISRIIMK